MLSFLKNYFNENYTKNSQDDSPDKKLQIATCALFMELAYSDDEFSDDEKELIAELMQNEFGLQGEEMEELMALSNEKMQRNISLYDYTDVINKYLDSDEKYAVLKKLWRLILIDGKLDSHEEYFIRKIGYNLHMEHKDLIAAKFEVKKEME